MNLLKLLSHFNISLSVSSFLILTLGIAAIATLSPANLPVQVIAACLAIGVYIVINLTHYQNWYQLSPLLYALALILLLSTLIIGSINRGASRWIEIGPISLQPSELARPICILFLARIASQVSRPNFRHLMYQILVALPPLVIIMLQPDLGSAILLALGVLGILIAQRLNLRYWLIGLCVLAVSIPLLWHVMHDYQRQRIFTFINPASDPSGSGYNVIQAQLAIGSGQITGRGLGRGPQSHLRFLPEHHTDFIFAAIAEELGLVGSVGIVILYSVLFGVFIKAITHAKDPFSHYLAAGLFMTLFGQTVINIGMNQGIMPVTGVTLPLLSYGGSSLLSTMFVLGLIGNIRSSQQVQSAMQIR